MLGDGEGEQHVGHLSGGRLTPGHDLQVLGGNARGVPRLHKEAAYLARRLTGIVCDMPIEATLDDLKPRPPDTAGLEAFFDAHGFGNILRRQARRIACAADNSRHSA